MSNGSMINGITIDAGLSNVISWSSSGDAPTAYQVQFYDNVLGGLVFDTGEVTSYNLTYTLPVNSLNNNKQYKILVTSFDKYNNSATSYGQVFNTSATPVVTMTAIANPVASPNYTFDATYTQANNSPVQSWIAYLYDSNSNIIAQSNIQNTTPIEYTFQGFQSGDSYYVEFECTGQNGLTGTSGLIGFTVQYSQPTQYATLTAINNDTTGSIDLSWNIIQIIGSTDIVGPINYIDNEMVDLTGGNNIWFEDSFSINSNFTLKAWLNSPVHNKNLLTLNGQNGQIYLIFGDDLRFHLYKNPTGSTKIDHYMTPVIGNTYFVSNNQVVVSGTSDYFAVIQQIGNDLNIFAQALN